MIFNDYYEMWNRYGAKLIDKIEISKEVLVKADLQNEVCDLIWVINAANQSNKSPANLSHTVIYEIKRLAPSLLSHKAFKKYGDPSEVEKRAERHYKGDHVMPSRFIQRQPKIENILKNYINNEQGVSVDKIQRSTNRMAAPPERVSSYIVDDDIKI